MLHIFLLSIIHEVFTKQIFDAAKMKHAVKSKWFNINPDDLDIAVYESQKIHGMTSRFDFRFDLIILVLTSELFQICDCEQNSDHPGHDLLTRAELEECDELTDLLSDLSLDREYYRWFMDTFFNQVSLASDSSANEIC